MAIRQPALALEGPLGLAVIRYWPLWLLYQLSPTQFPLKGGACKLGAADGAVRVVVLPGAAITVVADRVSVVVRPTRRVSIVIAIRPAKPTAIDNFGGRWPELGR